MSYDVTVDTVEPAALITLHAGAAVAPAVAAAVAAALGCDLPRGRMAGEAGGRRVFRIGPAEWLVAGPMREEQALLDALDGALGDDGAAVLVSDAYVALSVRGPDVLEVLAQAVAIDLHPRAMPGGTAVRCGFGKDSAILNCLESASAFVLYVDATLERYSRRLLAVASGG